MEKLNTLELTPPPADTCRLENETLIPYLSLMHVISKLNRAKTLSGGQHWREAMGSLHGLKDLVLHRKTNMSKVLSGGQQGT